MLASSSDYSVIGSLRTYGRLRLQQLCNDYGVGVIDTLDRLKSTGQIQKVFVAGILYYEINPSWTPKEVTPLAHNTHKQSRVSALDLHLMRWGTCKITAIQESWKPEDPPLYRLLK